MTSDLQKLRQDIWLSDLLSTEDEQGRHINSSDERPYCALGRLRLVGDGEFSPKFRAISERFGISPFLACAVIARNDGTNGHRLHSFPEIALWFKEQRDAWGGNLDQWSEER